MRHVAQYVVERTAHHGGIPLIATHEIGIKIEFDQLRVVVEHFLEMRHLPCGIYRVPCEATAQMIVNATRRHACAGLQNHSFGVQIVESLSVAQQIARQARRRKFRRAAKTAVHRIIGLHQIEAGPLQRRFGRHRPRLGARSHLSKL